MRSGRISSLIGALAILAFALVLSSSLAVASPEKLYLFADERYYTKEEFQLVKTLEAELQAAKLAPLTVDAVGLGALTGGKKAYTLIIVAHEGNAAPDVLVDPDGDGEIYDHSRLYTLPYMGVDCLPPTSWWQGPTRRSIPLEELLIKGARFIWVGQGLPLRISQPGPLASEITDLDLQRIWDEWITVANCNIEPHTSGLAPHTSNWESRLVKRLGLHPVSAERGIRLQLLKDWNNEYLSLLEYHPEEGERLVDAALVKVGAGQLGYLGPCVEPADTAANVVSLLAGAPWDTPWPVPEVETTLQRDQFSFWRGVIGGSPLHKVLLGDLGSFGESTLLVKPEQGKAVDILKNSSGQLDWNNRTAKLARNGDLRLCYSVRGTHMNAEESLYQWIRVFTEEREQPEWLCVNYVFPIGQNALLYAFILRPQAGALRDVEFSYQFNFNQPFEATGAGLPERLLWDDTELLAMPLTGNISELTAEGRKLAFRFKAAKVSSPTGFAFILVPAGKGEAGLATQLAAAQRFAISHLPEVYRSGLLTLTSAEELANWAFLVLPTPAQIQVVEGPVPLRVAGKPVATRPGQKPELQVESWPATVKIEGQWPWLPSSEGKRQPEERSDLLLVRASEAWRVWSSQDSSYSWARNLARLGRGFHGLGDALLEFDHHWIFESPTLDIMQDWYRLTGDERLLEFMSNVGNFQAEELLTPCGDYWRRAELYGLASDFCSAGLTGLRNELVLFEATGDVSALARAEHSARYVCQVSPFSLEAPFSRLAHNPLGPEGAFIYRDYPVRAENVAELAFQLLRLYRFTGKEEYLAFGKRAMEFLVQQNQRPEQEGGFCAVWLDANTEGGWGVDSWYGLHTTLASLSALREYYLDTGEEQYKQAADACIEGWIASRLFERDGLLLVGEKEQPWGLEFNWVALGRRLFEWAVVKGDTQLQQRALRLVDSTYAYCAAHELYDPKTANFAYPEYNGQVPAQSVFHMPQGQGPARLRENKPGAVELVVDLPAGDYVFSGRWPQKPVAVEVQGRKASLANGLEAALVSHTSCWYWHEGELSVRFFTQ